MLVHDSPTQHDQLGHERVQQGPGGRRKRGSNALNDARRGRISVGSRCKHRAAVAQARRLADQRDGGPRRHRFEAAVATAIARGAR
jgi:hypothetical protein